MWYVDGYAMLSVFISKLCNLRSMKYKDHCSKVIHVC